MANAGDALRQFVAAINQHDVSGVVGLMTSDHTFVDSMGNRMAGATSMEAAWRGYFGMCPDYWMRIDHVLAEDVMALAVGEAGGTIDGVVWRTPAAWKAVVREGRIAEWQVFADNKPVYEIVAKLQA